MAWRQNLALAVLASALLAFSALMRSAFVFPFPRLDALVLDTGKDFANYVSIERPLGAQGGMRDLSGVLLGMRRLTADIAWISILQYYGAHEKEELGGTETHEFGGGNYPALKKLTLRVTRLDPSFHYAYLYGAGALAFNLNRPEEALEILQEAIRYNPTYWKFRLYVGAIVFRQKGRFDQMIPLLEEAIHYPDCPSMVKTILANIYEERGDLARSLKVWMLVAEDPQADDWYLRKSREKIEALKARLGL